MSSNKKVIIIIIVLGLLVPISMVTGILMDRKDAPQQTKSGAKTINKDYQWPKMINSVTAFFRPKIVPSDLEFNEVRNGIVSFKIKKGEKSFRNMEISVEPTDGSVNASAFFRYYLSSSDTKLKEQKGRLKWYSQDKNGEEDPAPKESLAILKDGGILYLNPVKGSKIMMKFKDKKFMLCERTISGRYNYYQKK